MSHPLPSEDVLTGRPGVKTARFGGSLFRPRW